VRAAAENTPVVRPDPPRNEEIMNKEKRMYRLSGALALASVVVCGGWLFAEGKAPTKAAFGSLQAAAPSVVRAQALDWLKTTGKADADSLKSFDAVWASDRPLLEKVAATLALGDPDAKQLIANAHDPHSSAPTETPKFIRDTKLPAFYRANLALAYAKALSNRRVYEEALEALRSVRVEQVVDPSAFLFHKAVAEHALMLPRDAEDSIVRLLDDVSDTPERYKMVATLMHFDILSWKDKDLGWIARKMGNIERRLDLSRGGPKTQQMQREVVLRLDEIIKEIENQKNNQSSSNGGSCPNGGNNQNGTPNNNLRASNPQRDSNGGNGTGPGQIDPKRVKDLTEAWGTLPEKERAKALLELTRDMPPRYREVIENYFRKLSAESASK
jgi:hypothetical protein